MLTICYALIFISLLIHQYSENYVYTLKSTSRVSAWQQGLESLKLDLLKIFTCKNLDIQGLNILSNIRII